MGGGSCAEDDSKAAKRRASCRRDGAMGLTRASRASGRRIRAGLMRPAFEKYGFPAAAILTDWAAIAGPELAAFTAPERLKWPRRRSRARTGDDQGRHIACFGLPAPRALEVEHLPRRADRAHQRQLRLPRRHRDPHLAGAAPPPRDPKKPPRAGRRTPSMQRLLADLPRRSAEELPCRASQRASKSAPIRRRTVAL